ncbi:small glutamine-rich tetratricopeptide repeat-containing protein beta [Musca domestica]|uniref:Small glutamine-rich tetratricopeptide repeat-containing protein beta n=1 Tax=Musca domestica TaxID=7370 RepID=A0A1I8NIC2_MUSDO|nr:small glutamine-rich tetratricopeptide repeat-containing protein beta [Musca domestica]
MPDEVQQTFVRSFIDYLKKQIDSQAFSPDAQESCEVAIQCLQAAFDLGEEEAVAEEQSQTTTAPAGETGSSDASSTSKVNSKEVNLYELFEMHYVERNPEILKMTEAIKNEGNRLMKDGKYNEALLQYNRAITYDPKNPIFYCNRAAAYIRLGDNEKAITDCKSALVYNPNYGKAYGRLGIAYSNLGKYEEAQKAYAKAIDLEPENQDYRNNLEVARNASMHATANVIPNLQEGLNAMISNPAIRNLFSSAEIDLEQLQSMTQNPMVMNTIGQLFSGLQGGAGGGASAGLGGLAGGAGGVGPMPNDMLQLFQGFAQQLAAASQGGGNSGNQNSSSNNDQPPPPPPSSNY